MVILSVHISPRILISFPFIGSPEKKIVPTKEEGQPCSFYLRLQLIVAPGDISIYRTFCALTTISRSAVKSRILHLVKETTSAAMPETEVQVVGSR